MLNVIASGFLLSRARGERAVESISTQSVSLAECRLAPIRQQPPVREAVRWRRGRPFRWTMWPTPAGPLKPYESKVRTAVEQTPCCGCSAGKRQVVGLPGAREDRPIGPVHYLCRVWAAGALPASRAGPGLRRDVQTFCAIDQGADAFPLHCRSRRRSWTSLSFAGRRMSLRGFTLNHSADLLDRRATGSAGSATWPSQLSSADRGDLAELLPEYRVTSASSTALLRPMRCTAWT